MKKLLPILVILSLLLNVCKTADKEGFDRKLLMAQLVENVILLRHQEFQDLSDELYQITQNFHANPTLASFQSVREKWLETKLAYKHTAVFNFGTISETVVHNKLNKWPSNTAFIDGFLADTVTLDQVYVDGKGSTSKGLPAIEYLLFNPSVSEADMFDSFVNASDAERKKDLLLAYSNDLFFKAYFLNDLWQPTGDNFGSFLATTEPTSGLGSPVEMLLNEMIARIEFIVHTELGKPLGIDNSGIVNEEEAEAFRSRESLLCVREGLVSLKETLVGDVANGSGQTSASLENHLIACDAGGAAGEIIERLDNAIALIDAYPTSFEDGLNSNPQGLTEIREELVDIITLLKVDAIYALSATLTFNDNDGD